MFHLSFCVLVNSAMALYSPLGNGVTKRASSPSIKRPVFPSPSTMGVGITSPKKGTSGRSDFFETVSQKCALALALVTLKPIVTGFFRVKYVTFLQRTSTSFRSDQRKIRLL